KAELAKEIYKMLQKLEGKVHAIAKLLARFQEQSQKQVTERQFEDALKFLSDEEKLMIVGKQVRLS
ncbi:hypothetical protein, partial [Salmonella sp. s54836]|uniref:hypothetical protein n=1 Tax=Salmonella sp. s54836 TaxID=3159673 RepID=UPI00397FE2A3